MVEPAKKPIINTKGMERYPTCSKARNNLLRSRDRYKATLREQAAYAIQLLNPND